MAGSRPGTVIAGTWAAICKLGDNKYTEFAKAILSCQQKMIKLIDDQVPQIRVANHEPSVVMSVVTRDDVENPINVIALADVMSKQYKWALTKTQRPPGMHIAVTMANCHEADKFVSDIKASIVKMEKDPKLNTNSTTAAYGMVCQMPDTEVLDDACKQHTAACLDTLGE